MNNLRSTIVCGAVLATVTVGVLISRDSIRSSNAQAVDEIRLTGAVRDFRRVHPDFGAVPARGYGHDAGLVNLQLAGDGAPTSTVPDGRPITSFANTGGPVIPPTSFATKLTVLGAAVQAGSGSSRYDQAVTVEVQIGAAVFQPFGPFGAAVAGNVNDGTQHETVLSLVHDAGSPISIAAKKWSKHDTSLSGDHESDWYDARTVTSAVANPFVIVLRDGDTVPSYAPTYDQGSIETFLDGYIDFATNQVTLAANQVIYLFEVGTTNASSGDFQDLVMLVDLATDPSFFAQQSSLGGSGGQLSSGFRVGSEWRDRNGNAIAPHLYRAPDDGVVPLVSAPSFSDHPVLDTYDATGPYDPASAGPAPIIDTGRAMPTFTVPVLPGSSDFDVSGSGTTVLDADRRFDRFDAVSQHVVRIEGNVRIHVTGDFRLENQAAIELADGASLELYVDGDIGIQDHADINANTGDPDRVTIYAVGPGTFRFQDGSLMHARIVAPSRELDMANQSELFGSYAGQSLRMANGSELHIDGLSATMCGTRYADVAGTATAPSAGAISSSTTFHHWFRNMLGTNLTTSHDIVLVRNADGVYEYIDNAFHPIDNLAFGNESEAHNNYFTFQLEMACTYNECTGQFIEFMGSDDAWVFIDRSLAIDLGGVYSASPSPGQRVDLDRLGLVDGQRYAVSLFYANRSPNAGVFQLRTNLDLDSTRGASVSAAFD